MSLCILVVDDSAVMRSMLIRTLRMSALPVSRVLQAESAAQAMQRLEEFDVHVALIDLDMPGASGDELLDQVRADARYSALRVVMVIPEGAVPGSAAAAALRGAIPLKKPFSPDQLRSTLLHLLGVVAA